MFSHTYWILNEISITEHYDPPLHFKIPRLKPTIYSCFCFLYIYKLKQLLGPIVLMSGLVELKCVLTSSEL